MKVWPNEFFSYSATVEHLEEMLVCYRRFFHLNLEILKKQGLVTVCAT